VEHEMDARNRDGYRLIVAPILHLPPSIATSFRGNAQAFQTSLSSTPILIFAAGLGALVTLMLFGIPLDVIGIIGPHAVLAHVG
jgi:hypothetical protein